MFSPLKQSDPAWFEFEWLRRVIRPWAADELVAVGAIRKPNVPSGFLMKCLTAVGSTGAREPALPSVATAVVVDTGVTWEMVPYATNIPVLSNHVFTTSPAGIVIVDDDIVPALLLSRVKLDAGLAAVGLYEITATIEDASGEEYVNTQEIEVVE